MEKGVVGKGVALVLLLGLIVIGIFALADGDSETDQVAGDAIAAEPIEAEVAAATEVPPAEDTASDVAEEAEADDEVVEADTATTTVAPTTSTTTTTSTTVAPTTSTSSSTSTTSSTTTTSTTTSTTTTAAPAPVATTPPEVETPEDDDETADVDGDSGSDADEAGDGDSSDSGSDAAEASDGDSSDSGSDAAESSDDDSEPNRSRGDSVSDAADSVGDEDEEAQIGDEAIFFGSPFPGQVTFLNGEFVRLEAGPDGFEVLRSSDGGNWQAEPTTGLPEFGFVQSFDSFNGGLVAILEVEPDFTDDIFFGEFEQIVATSTDGQAWVTTDLPDVMADGGFTFVVGAAVSGGQLGVLVSVEPAFNDPFQIIFESGLLTDEQLENFCDIGIDGPGEPVIVTSCDFEEIDALFEQFEEDLANAETEEEKLEIEDAFFEAQEDAFFGEEILRIEPGEEFYDEIVDGFFGNDPFQLLLDAGLLTEDQLNNLCDVIIDGPGEPVIITTCNFGELDEAFAEFDEELAELVEAFENAETDEEREAIEAEKLALEEEFFALEEGFFGDEDLFAGDEVLRLEPGDEFYDEFVEGFFGFGSVLPPLVITGPLGGTLDIVELPVAGFANSIVATDDGFIATVFDNFTGGTAVLRSPDGLNWTQVERFVDIADGDEFSDVRIASNDELALAIVVDFGGPEQAAPVVLTSDDLGVTWSESPIPTELFNIFPQAVGGPGGFAAIIGGSTEPFNDFFFGPEVVEIEQDGFIMEINLNEGIGALRTVDGTVIHEEVFFEEAFFEGEIPNVLRIDTSIDSEGDAIWLDPDTGEVLVTFLGVDIDDAVNEAFETFEEQQEFEEPEFVRELWFSVDGETWILLETFDDDDGDFTTIAAVGDDEILLLTESFPIPPDELFVFEEEGRDPTEEEIEAIDEFFLQEPTFTWILVPIS